VGELNRIIPTIGLMIGMYIITRMIKLLMTQKKDQLLPLGYSFIRLKKFQFFGNRLAKEKIAV
jgi:hypothetical protein